MIKLIDTAYWQATSEIASRLVPVLRQPPENRSQSELDTLVSILSRIELFGSIDANHLREVCAHIVYIGSMCAEAEFDFHICCILDCSLLRGGV